METNEILIPQQGPEILISKKNIIWDATVASTVMLCGRKADLKHNHNLTSIGGKGTSLEMGLIVHHFLEIYYKAIIAGLSKTQAAGQAYISATEYCNSAEITNTSDEDKAWALETCQLYLDYYKNDFWTPLEVEQVKGKVIYEDDDIRLLWKAKYDLISDTNQAILPVDHKTSKQRRMTLELNNQFMGQCVLLGTRSMVVNKVGFQKTLKPAEKFERAIISYSFDKLLEWQSVILPYWAKMYVMYEESGYYPPNFTSCDKFGKCEFYDACNTDRSLREETLGQNFIVGKTWDPSNE